MLSALPVERIAEIAALAKRLRADRDGLVERARIDRHDDAGDPLGLGRRSAPAGAIDDGLDDPDALGDTGALAALTGAIDGLMPEQRRELLALLYVGRGEFTASEWEQALSQAETVPDMLLGRQAIDEPLLPEYLKKGLYAIGRAR